MITFFIRTFFLLLLSISYCQAKPLPKRIYKSELTRSFFSEISKFNQKNKQKLCESLDNIYPVEEGKFYRSHQLPVERLDFYIKQLGIKTIINLRGDDEKEWLLKEKKVAENNHVLYFSIPMSAVYISKKEDLIKLLTIYDEAPRPILLHCIGGADRTGEASALWVLEQQKKSIDEALEQLSIAYGHRKYKNSAKDFLISIWKDKAWLYNDYNEKDYPQYARPTQ